MMRKYVFRSGAALVAVALVLGVMVARGPGAQSDTASAVLDLPTYGGGGGSSSGEGVAVQSVIGQPDASELEGDNVTVNPGPAPALPPPPPTVTDACPALAGLTVYWGCPAGVRSQTSLKITDNRTPRSACGNTNQTCTRKVAGAKLLIFDRTKLNGLTITKRTGGSVKLTKTPPAALYDDIYESATARSAARAADFGCTTNNLGVCFGGVTQPTDLLVLVKFADSAGPGPVTTIWVGRSLTAASFTDFDRNGTKDRAKVTQVVTKTIASTGAVTYGGTGVVKAPGAI